MSQQTEQSSEDFVAEQRKSSKGTSEPVSGSLVDYESTKIKRTTLSTTVAELYSFMKCFGTYYLKWKVANCKILIKLWSF